MSIPTRAPALKIDKVLAEPAAAAAARAALEEFAEPGAIGAEAGFEMLQERLGVHYFTCAARAYPGWRWAVSVARVPRGKVATVCETTLVPGEGALLSPPWVPYADRLAPGDLGPGDTTAYVADDPLLEAGFEATGLARVGVSQAARVGVGRVRRAWRSSARRASR